MEDPGDPHAPRPAASSPAPSFRRKRRSPGSRGKVVAIVLLLLGAGLAGWLLFGPSDDSDPPVTTAPQPSGPEAPPPGTGIPGPPPLDLPELSASDAFIRDVVSRLSSHPQLATWLVPDELVYRFVGLVIDLAGASTPAEHVTHMAPAEAFQTATVDGQLTLDPEGHRRFDLLAATFASLDTGGSAILFRQLQPLMEQAFDELGLPDITFEETLVMAARNILAVDIPQGPIRVEPHEGVYIFSDPGLEERRGLDKQLIRMGPGNTGLIQEKVRELATELDLAL